jgi:glycine/D-amino acid oxidase-like deaminating enzyme
MAEKSLDYWLELERESGQELLVRTGLLMIDGEDESANRFNKTSYETLMRLGLGAEDIDQHDFKLRFPQFTADHGYFDSHGGVLLASKSLALFRQLANVRKVVFLTENVSKTIPAELPTVTLESHKTIRCRKLVITIGPWSNSLLRSGLPEMFPMRQQLIYFQPKTQIDHYRPVSFPVFFTDHHYGLPAAGIGAVKVSPKQLFERIDPDKGKDTVDPGQVEACRDICRKYVPGLSDSTVVHSRVCYYDMTKNTDFVLDKDPDNENVIYGYGFSGHGFKFAPLIGKLLAELALDMKPSFNIERFMAEVENREILGRGQLGQGE